MKITTFKSLADGSLSPKSTTGDNPMSGEARMTRAVFEQVYGGAQVTDLAAARVNHIPPGTMLWRTKSGVLMAIAD
jgi:hypothetical protein